MHDRLIADAAPARGALFFSSLLPLTHPPTHFHSLGALALVLTLCAVAAAASSSSTFAFSMGGAGRLQNPFCADNPVCGFNDWVNGFFFSDATRQAWMDRAGAKAAHYLLTYLRDLLAGSVLYYVTAGLWHAYIYGLYGDYFFTQQGFEKPSGATIRDQVQLAQASMFLYAALPVFSEWLIESGWTLCYFHVAEVGGWAQYAVFTLLYLALVEVGIYWMHRTLHENKWLYKHVHALHHKYNKPSTLSPWASVAFNPIDGILQASPYVACLFLVPCHYLTHVVMVFFTAVWATNIHDAMDGDTEPVMGSKYHTLHHTHYHYKCVRLGALGFGAWA
jgi:Delta7-sterol 5-desaturase